MDQLTLLLAVATCRLSDLMKIIEQQEALIKTLHAQGRSAPGAEALLETFQASAAVIIDQRKRLERQMMSRAPKAHDRFGVLSRLSATFLGWLYYKDVSPDHSEP